LGETESGLPAASLFFNSLDISVIITWPPKSDERKVLAKVRLMLVNLPYVSSYSGMKTYFGCQRNGIARRKETREN
jgi:hypothetical protein